MSFSSSCKDISLDGSILVATCTSAQHDKKTETFNVPTFPFGANPFPAMNFTVDATKTKKSVLDLDAKFGNNHGALAHNGRNFSFTAIDTRLVNGKLLACALPDGRGGTKADVVNLDDYIENVNGVLSWK